ncbi:MAG: hypothetical protein KJ626_06995 [Verrucomicrobia bacterium]|nr:hypothetical protein [Verrucomicrobiota bacterium]
MRKLFVLLAVAAVAIAWSGVQADAGSGCCPYSKDKKTDAGTQGKKACSYSEDCSEAFSALDLSAEQKEALSKLSADCDKTACDKTSKSKWSEGVTEILSEEQLEQLKESCKAKGRSCSLIDK